MPSVTPFSAWPGRAEPSPFRSAWQAAAARPLAEIRPAAPGDAAGALGFALAWTAAADAGGTAPLLWITPEACLAEDGAPYAPGLAQFGYSLPRLLLVRTRAQQEAYWAAEQALVLPKARVLCTIERRGKFPLVASRRLLLAAEKSGARCLLLRFDAACPSASWSRWRVAARIEATANGRRARVAGLVLVRQRPGTASGVIFMTL